MSTAQHMAPDREWFAATYESITANRDIGPIEQPGRHRKPTERRHLLRRLRRWIGRARRTETEGRS